MEYQDKMVKTNEEKGREETLVCRHHLDHKVYTLICSITMMNILRTTIFLLLIADLKYSHSLFCPEFCDSLTPRQLADYVVMDK